MCGIAAALGPNSQRQVESMVNMMLYRGTRSKIISAQDKSARKSALGHVRLPIVGTDTRWDQPIEITRGRLLGFVGEILDFRDVVSDLECDLQVVQTLWEAGPSAFSSRDGFWSVVEVDPENCQIHALVDYLAQKPLYYRADERVTAIASEPGAVAALAPTTPDRIYLAAVVKWGYCPDLYRTPYNEIKKTLPGEAITLRPGVVRRSRIDTLTPRKMSLEVLKNEIILAIRRRTLSADVPVAALVSGGLDSSIVYTMARRMGDVRAFHVPSPGEVNPYPEAQVLTASHQDDETCLIYMQEPMDLGSLIPQVELSEAVGAKKFRVCLTGDGADEAFGGYARSMQYDSQWSDVFQELPGWHLPRLDRVMMRNKVEVRSPFLARRVLEGALALPYGFRRDKKWLRYAFSSNIGKDLASRPKIPLKSGETITDRVGRSARLVEKFMWATWGDQAYM